MERKEFRKIRNKEEWLELWEQNEIPQVAVALLKAKWDYNELKSTADFIEMNKLIFEIVKLYAGSYSKSDHPGSEIYEAALKEWIQMLRSRFAGANPGWWDYAEFSPYWEEVIDFLEKYCAGKTPYSFNSHTARLIKECLESFWTVSEIWEYHREQQKFLKKHGEAIKKILLVLGDYEFLDRKGFLTIKTPPEQE